MTKNIAFIGGIHGVGKSLICQQICRELNMEYLSASELLQWRDINEDDKNKKVKDIHHTQNRLLLGLMNLCLLIIGYFCIFFTQKLKPTF